MQTILMIILRKQIDGLMYSWTIYRDGRTVQAFFGVDEPWMLDEDINEKTKELFTFRFQARRRMQELISEKQADGYEEEVGPDPIPSRKEKFSFRRRMMFLAYSLIGAGLFPILTPWSLSPYVILMLAVLPFIMSLTSGNMLPFWAKAVCFISYVLINTSYKEAPDVQYLDSGLLIATGVFLYVYMTVKRQRIESQK